MAEIINNKDLCIKMGNYSRKIVEEKYDVRLVNNVIMKTINSL